MGVRLRQYRAALITLAAFLAVTVLLATDGPLTPLFNLRGRTDDNGYLLASSASPGGSETPLTPLSNLRGRTDENGYLRIALSGSSVINSPVITGGTGTTSTLTLQPTSGVGTTGADLLFNTGNNGATKAARIYNNGAMSIGTPCAATGCTGPGVADLQVTAQLSGTTLFEKFASAVGGPLVLGRHARGSITAPTAILSADTLFTIGSAGWEVTTPGWSNGTQAQIKMFAAEDFTSTAQGTRMGFFVTTSGTTTGQQVLQLHGGGMLTGGSTPTVANVGANSCGTSTATLAGNNITGEVTVGTVAGTQCRVTMSAGATTRFNGACTNTTTAALCRLVAVSNTTFDLLGVFAASDVLSYYVVSR